MGQVEFRTAPPGIMMAADDNQPDRGVFFRSSIESIHKSQQQTYKDHKDTIQHLYPGTHTAGALQSTFSHYPCACSRFRASLARSS